MRKIHGSAERIFRAIVFRIARHVLVRPAQKRVCLYFLGWFPWLKKKLRFLFSYSYTQVLQDPQTFHSGKRQLFVDVSNLQIRGRDAGISRVCRKILKTLLENPPSGFSVEPVCATKQKPGYCYARSFFEGESDLAEAKRYCDAKEGVIQVNPGDIFLGLAYWPDMVMIQEFFLADINRAGVTVFFVVYDLLPVTIPEKFPSSWKDAHAEWLNIISRFSGAICISLSVADDLKRWLQGNNLLTSPGFKIEWFHLGADIDQALPKDDLSQMGDHRYPLSPDRPFFLMVGTVEPRKGHSQILDVFEKLWEMELDIDLVLVGYEGWMVSQLAKRIRTHEEYRRHLFWLEQADDDLLSWLYVNCRALIGASESEGFGLPLIEAARHGAPIIARDIPVFREVTSGEAFFFKGVDSSDVAESFLEWIKLFESGTHPQSVNMPWLTWEQSTQNLISKIL